MLCQWWHRMIQQLKPYLYNISDVERTYMGCA
jgi:hypothetical protein